MATLEEIVREVDRRAPEHAIGGLQNLRKRLRGLRRMPTRNVFDYARNPGWTFHVGGRDELQFNLGIEEPFGNLDLRYGVAFSFELSRSLKSLDPLVPRVAAFNDYVREHLEDLSDLWMWHHSVEGRSALRTPGPIEAKLVREGVFVFMGALGRSENPDFEDMLATLDRLFPLWRSIEEGLSTSAPSIPGDWKITPGLPPRIRRTVLTTVERALAMDLRHVGLQNTLYHELVAEHGFDAVGVEQPAPGGGVVDVVAHTAAGKVIFEIKTAGTARGCIREAMGQLLDYGCWPTTPRPVGLCVVGEPEADHVARSYLHELNRHFPVPIAYRKVSIA
jgi:hypothetical protein